MGYLFLAVVFYTVVKFSVEVWTQIAYRSDNERREAEYHRNEIEFQELKNKA